MSGSQCHLRLWYETYARDLAGEPDDALQAVFDTGHEVGELACERYPGGHLVAHDYRHVAEALEETRRILASGSAPTLFEPAFRHQGVLVRVDVLERLPKGGWGLVEVKSTTKLKEHFVLDAAVQLWVLRGAGLDVREAGVLTLNRDYVYEGGEHDLNQLFKLHPVMDDATALHDAIGAQVSEMQAMLGKPKAPNISPGEHCTSPYDCPFLAHCTKDLAHPDHGIGELPWLGPARRAELKAQGIDEIRDIPEDFPLSDLQQVIRRAVRGGQDVVHGDVQKQLVQMETPLHYLDFETFSPPSRASPVPARMMRFPFCSPFTSSATDNRRSTSTTCTTAATTHGRGSRSG